MKLDRLISRIRAALQNYASEFEQRALAAEYADWCAQAARRLEQVVPLIREGQDFPALQIAESPPSVLDLVRQLSFAEVDLWRAFCRQRSLPAAPPFDERSVQLVNQLYAKKISETHPLYREYRQAIRLRHYDQALRVLQSIRRINHDDANAHAEFARLARQTFERRRAELAAALDRHDNVRALALLESCEADDLSGRDEDPTWQRAVQLREGIQRDAARARCLELAAQLRQFRAQNRWQDALPVLAEWETLHSQHKITLPPEIAEDAAGARKWASGLLARRERTQECQRQWTSLTARLDEIERVPPAKKSRRALAAELAEVTGHSAELAAQANDGNGYTPPPDLVARLEKEAALMRRNLRQRKLAAGSLIAAAVLGLIASAAFGIRQHLRNVRRQTALAAIEQHFKTGATSVLATDLQTYDANFSSNTPDEAGAKLLEQARSFVKNHQAALDRYNQELADLRQAADKPAPSQISGLLARLDDLEKEATGLGADDAQHAEVSLKALRLQLNQQLAGDQDARATRLEAIYRRANLIQTGQLSGPLTADAAQAAAEEALKIIAEANDIPSSADLSTPLELTTREQLAELGKIFAAKAAAAHEAQAARAQLAQARSLEDYHAAIQTLAGNPLTGDPTVAAARALAGKNPDWSNAAQNIWLPGDAPTWAFLANLGQARLFPSEDNPKEGADFYRLAHNEALGNTYRADHVTYADDKETAREQVFLAGRPVEEDTKNAAEHVVSMTAKLVKADGSTPEIQYEWIQFTGQKGHGDKLENVQLAAESKLVVRLAAAYDPGNSAIREPLLRVLDDVRSDSDAAPILKAFLHQAILGIMQNRPRDWGLAFSRAAHDDAIELAQITGGHLTAADWLYANVNSKLTHDLRAFYQRTGSLSYYDQALATEKDLLKKRAQPVRFAGYVDAEDTPRLAAPPATGALWGLNSAGAWQALFDLHGGQPARAAGNPAPARLTPLLDPGENGTP